VRYSMNGAVPRGSRRHDEDDDYVTVERSSCSNYGEEEIAPPFRCMGALCPQKESTDNSTLGYTLQRAL
jgi:hypothetical protein